MKPFSLRAVALLIPIEAFTPVSTLTGGTSSLVTVPSLTAAKAAAYASTTTALPMGLLDRVFRVAQANTNLSLEDPEKIMNQAVSDMQKDMMKIRETYAQVSATQRRLQEHKAKHDAAAREWHSRATCLATEQGRFSSSSINTTSNRHGRS